MNAIGLVILTSLILEFGLRILSEVLNLRSSHAELPETFKGFADRIKTALLAVFLMGPLLAMILGIFDYFNRFSWLY